jgi:DNA polymerase
MNDILKAQVRSQTRLYLQQQSKRGKKYLRIPKEIFEGLGSTPTQSPSLKKGEPLLQKAPLPPSRATSRFSETEKRKSPMTDGQRQAFEALKSRALSCQKCSHLVKFRKQVVFGVGNSEADLMFVGEAPGADEDDQGEPFVGRAGQLLTKMIQAMGLQRSDVYIANILKCRPDIQAKSGNRKPTPEEMETCVPYLKEQIQWIRPRVLVAVGDTAVKGLLPTLKTTITRIRGNWLEFENIPLMPTFHPSYLLHNQSLALKRQCWEDLLQVMERLEMPRSEKQKNYFLTAMNSGVPSS